MSDYLGTIVARSTGDPGSAAARDDNATIRPRLPSLFEPLAGASPVAIEESPETSPMTMPRTDRGRRVSRFVSPAGRDLSTALEKVSHADASQRRDDLPEPVATFSISIAEEIDQADRQGRLHESASHDDSDHASSSGSDDRVVEPASLAGEEFVGEVDGFSASAARTETFESVPSPSPPAGTAARRLITNVRPARRPPPRDGLARHLGRARTDDRSTSDADEAVSESPAIHVTIGRVEIRAAVPPPAQNKRAPTRTGLSLDEFLGKPVRSDR